MKGVFDFEVKEAPKKPIKMGYRVQVMTNDGARLGQIGTAIQKMKEDKVRVKFANNVYENIKESDLKPLDK